MAITSLDGIIAGGQPCIYYRTGRMTITRGTIQWFTPHYLDSIPGCAVPSTAGISGEALTSYPGFIPFTNPPVGQKKYLARFSGSMSTNGGTVMLADRLWHNSGVSVSTTAVQTVNSVAFPPRDVNESSDGEGVYVAIEMTSQQSGNATVMTLGYTNSLGVAGRTAVTVLAPQSSQPTGQFYPMALAPGDSGVRKVDTIQFNFAFTGSISLVAYRPITIANCHDYGVGTHVDSITGGMPVIFNNSVPFLIYRDQANGPTGFEATIVYTQG